MSIVIWCGREISEQGVSFTFRRIYSYHSLKLKYEYTGENNHLFSVSYSSAKTSVHFYKHGSSREQKIKCFKFRAVGEKREEIGERQESFNCHGITALNKISYWLETGILPLNINECEKSDDFTALFWIYTRSCKTKHEQSRAPDCFPTAAQPYGSLLPLSYTTVGSGLRCNTYVLLGCVCCHL